MIIGNPCSIYKKDLRIAISEFDLDRKEKINTYLNPKDINNFVLTNKSSISTEILKLKPDLNIVILNKGKPISSLVPIDNLPKILTNESLFSNLSKYKRKKLRYIFCKGVCSSRIKVLSRLNEKRKNIIVKDILDLMRKLDKKLIKSKTREELMGIEGNITKYFYNGLAEFNDYFDITRNRNSKDIVNILMNFTHTFLRNKIYYRLILNGLNPYHSFLHNNNRNQAYLCFDFAEFWIAYIDKLIFYSLERRIIKVEDINKEGILSKNSIKKIINLINKRIPDSKIDSKIKEFKEYLKGKNRFGWVIHNDS